MLYTHRLYVAQANKFAFLFDPSSFIVSVNYEDRYLHFLTCNYAYKLCLYAVRNMNMNHSVCDSSYIQSKVLLTQPMRTIIDPSCVDFKYTQASPCDASSFSSFRLVFNFRKFHIRTSRHFIRSSRCTSLHNFACA